MSEVRHATPFGEGRRFVVNNPAGAVRLIARCGRALTRAHFDSAGEERSLLGATKQYVRKRLQEEELPDADWRTFLELCDVLPTSSPRPELRTEGDVYHVLGRRRSANRRSRSRPTVFEILDELLGTVLPRTLLTDWYRDDLLARHEVRDSTAFLDFAQIWIDSFNRVNAEDCSREHLLHLASLPEAASDADLQKKWAEALIELLEYLRVVRFAPRNLQGYRIRSKANTASTLCHLFGRSTGTTGLDELLSGGLWVPGRLGDCEGLTLVVSGEPGFGKSTLATGLGLQVAARGGISLFFTFEVEPRAIRRQIALFHRRLLPFLDLELDPDLRPPAVPDPPHRGRVVVSEIPTAPFREVENTILHQVQHWSACSFSERMVILDPVSAVEGYATDLTTWRTRLFRLTHRLRSEGYVVVFLVERKKGDEDGFEHYLAEIDIRLSSVDSRECPYPFRTIEVTKSRNQASQRGTHVISIEPDVGMQVYPSSPAVIGTRRRAESRIRYAQSESITTSVEGFSKYLGGSTAAETSRSAVGWWKAGSVTAIVGPRGTYKSAFAHVFTRDSVDRRNECALSLHLADDFPLSHVRLRAEDRQPMNFGVRYDQHFRGGTSSLTYVLFRSGYVAPGFILQIIRDLIAERRRAQTPFKRAAIVDAGNIAADFPALKADPTFLPALCELLAAEGVTTLLVYSLPRHGAPDYVVDQVLSVSENIIQVDRVAYAGQQYTSVFVERSVDSTHDRGVYEIRDVGSDNGEPRLSILPRFDLVVDVPRNPTSAGVKVLLHEETDLQQEYHSSIRRLHQNIGAYKIEVLSHAVGFAQHRVARHIMAGEKALWVAQLDGYDFPARSDESTAEVLCDLAEIEPSIRELRRQLIDAPQSTGGSVPDFQRAFSIPYYLNPSFLVAQDDFVEFTRSEPRWSCIADGLGNYSWQQLIEAALAFRQAERKYRDYFLFDCPLETAQNLNCFYLEILESLLSRDLTQEGCQLNERDCLELFDLSERTGTVGNQLVEGALLMHRLLSPSYSWHTAEQRNRRDASESVETVRPFVSPRAIFWRLWYATFRQLAADLGGGDRRLNPGLTLLRLPGNIWTNGDWHLGVLKGSIGVREGVKIIREEFVEPSAAMARLAQGVGLSPFKSFYQHSSQVRMPVSHVRPDWFEPYVHGRRVIQRSGLRHYKSISPLMNLHLFSMLALRHENEEVLKASFREILASLHELGQALGQRAI